MRILLKIDTIPLIKWPQEAKLKEKKSKHSEINQLTRIVIFF